MLKASSKKLEKKKGEIIFKKGTNPSGVFIILKGKVKIHQANQNGKSQILYIYRKGEFFGYKPLLCNETHPVTAEALEDVSMLFIPKATFLKVVKASQALSTKLLFHLSYEFSVWVNTATVFAQQSVRQRFALTLLILNEKYRNGDQVKTVELNLTREDLASYVGTAVETLVRIMRELKDKKIIAVKGRKIKILDLEALSEMTELY